MEDHIQDHHNGDAQTSPNESADGPALVEAEDPDERQKRALGLGQTRPRTSSKEASGEELEQMKSELASVEDKLKRQVAEFQNYKKRTTQEKSQLVEYGKSLVVQNLLEVIDDFDRSRKAAETLEQQDNPAAAYEAFKQGVDLVYNKFMDELTRLGVEPIVAVGQPFDEKEHEALMQQPAPEGTGSGVVLHEAQKGYRMGDRVLRHSRVVVSA
ncbi:MAG: nucleotide exchange factor GrpE [Rhodothermales bacterium]